MKLIQKYTVIAGLAIALSVPAQAANGRGGGGGRAGGGGGRSVATHAGGGGFRPQAAHFSAPSRSFASSSAFRGSAFRSSPRTVYRSNTPRVTSATRRLPAISQGPTTRFNTATTGTTGNRFRQATVKNTAITNRTNFATARNTAAFNRGVRGNAAYTRANNYGGRWFAANTHPGWNRGGEYYWNHHHYRWFDGGWLIVDAGMWPYGYPYGYPYAYDYGNQPVYAGSSVAADVQSRLAQLGYYQGDVDGDVGPLTQQAIASYQSDQGLPVTGQIDQPLLQSLGIA